MKIQAPFDEAAIAGLLADTGVPVQRVEVSYLQMLGYLPVIFFAATVPTPMRAAAITSWVILFPGNEGQMATFGVFQHNFFILFNATIGLLFLRKAQAEMFSR